MKTTQAIPSALLVLTLTLLLFPAGVARGQEDPAEFEVIARTGSSSGLTKIGRGPSINDLGYVAFTARRSQGDEPESENVYSVHPTTRHVQPLMNHIFEYPASNADSPTQLFDAHVQVNNQNQVLAWRNLNAKVQQISWIILPFFGDFLTAPLSYLETWPVTGNVNNPGHIGLPDSLVQMGDGGGGDILTLGPVPGVTSLYFIKPATGRVYPSPFAYIGIHIVHRNGSINNLGQVAYSALQFDGAELFKTSGGSAGVTGSVVEPVIADDGYSVLRLGTATGGRLVRLPFSVFPTETFANTIDGFTSLGRPTISDDGKIIVYYGNLTNTNRAAAFGTTVGPGLFAYFTDRQSSIRVSGVMDKNDPSSPPIISYDPEERPSVNNLGTVVFTAINDQGRKAIFSSVINLKAPTRTALPPTQVVATGDEVDGLPGALDDLTIHDALNNAGKHGDILFWASSGSVQAVVKVPATACEACQCAPGDLDCKLGSINAKLGLGRTPSSSRAGYLRIKANLPSSHLATPAGLTLSGSGAFGRVYATNAFSSSNVLRQVKGPSILADIVVETPYRYTVRFYETYGARDARTGLYPPQGIPTSTVTVENPDGATSINRLRLSRNATENFEFTYTPASGAWEMLSGMANALQKETEVKTTNGPLRTVTRTVKDASNNLLSQTVTRYQKFPWGEELVQSIEGLDDVARTTTYTYYTNQVVDGANYTKLRSVIQPEGSWQFYKEYQGDVVTKQVSQFQNKPYAETATWPDPQNRCSETIHFGSLETHIEYLKGHPISKRWQNQVSASERWSSVATTPTTTNWNDKLNLITRSFVYTSSNTNGASVGKTSKVIHPDGTMSQYFYYTELINDPYLPGTGTPPKVETTRTVALNGRPNAAQTSIIDGTRNEQVEDALGNSISRKEYDIASNLLMASEATTSRDTMGRATRIDYLGGSYVTRTYDCCGLAEDTDREGIVTSYSTGGTVSLDLDKDGTPETYAGTRVTRAGLSTYMLNDSMGRSTHTVLQGTEGALIVQEQRGYDREGNLAWSLDAMNRRTTYSKTTEGPFRLTITSFPDGSRSVAYSYQDGSTYQTKGDAVQGIQFGQDMRQDKGVWVQTSIQTRLETDGSLSPEYTTTYTDFAGRNYKTEHPWPDGPGPVFATRNFNAKGQLVSSTDPDGLTTLYAYNARGELEITALDVANPGVIDFGGTDRLTRTTTSVTKSGLRDLVVRRFVTERWETNGVSQNTVLQTSETSADGSQSWSTQYGLTTHTITTLDRANQRRTVTTELPDGTSGVTVFEQGRQKSTTRFDKNGDRINQTTVAHDSFGRLQAQIDARNGATTYTYYDDGQIHTVTTPDPDPSASGPGLDPQTTSYAYFRDPVNGQKTVTTLPDGGVVTQEFFPNGQLKKTWGARTYPAEYTYDRAGRMATLTTWQQFNFDAGTGIAGSATTRWNYNARGLLANKRYADDKGPSYSHTAGGKPKTRLWARGVLTTYGYDEKTGDSLTTTYSDATPSVTNTYTRSGQLQSVTDASGLRSFGYHHGQTATEAYGPGLFAGLTLVRDYDELDRQRTLSITSPTGSVYNVSYGYDAASRLNTVSSGPDVATYTYHPDSGLISTLTQSHSNAVRLITSKHYDNLGRLQSIASVPSADSPISFTYRYNDANQRSRATLANGEYWTYGYDPLGQVTSGVKRFPNASPIPGYTFGYDFDTIGNRLSASRETKTDNYTNNALNQIADINYTPWLHVLGAVNTNASITVNGQTPIRSSGYFYAQLPATSVWNTVSVQARVVGEGINGTASLAEETGHLLQPTNAMSLHYDDDGNLLSDGNWVMTWDAENRITKKETMRTLPHTAQRRLEYVIDSRGRRVLVRCSDHDSETWKLTSSRSYLASDLELLAEVQVSDNNAIQTYVWGLDLTGTRDGAGGVGGLLSLNSEVAHPSVIHLATFDGNGNVAGLIEATTGTQSARYEYDPFGGTLRLSGHAATLNPIRFSTKITGTETGDIHYEMRDYCPSVSRWLSRDPLSEYGGVNVYGFSGGDPVNKVDVLGMYEVDFHFYAIYYMLRAKCWSHQEADQVAKASQAVDDEWQTNPLYRPVPGYIVNNLGFREQHFLGDHFPGSSLTTPTKRNDGVVRQRVINQFAQWKLGQQGDAASLGKALHTYADTWSHDGYTGSITKLVKPNRYLAAVAKTETDPFLKTLYGRVYQTVGHLEDGHEPDQPFRDPNKSNEAIDTIYGLIPCRAQNCNFDKSILQALKAQLVKSRDADSEWRSVGIEVLTMGQFRSTASYP